MVKAGTFIIALIVIAGIWIFLVPPSFRCKFHFWDSQACTKVQEATQLLKPLGFDIDPNMPAVTQIDEFVEGVNRTT